MSGTEFTDSELEAYLDEDLPAADMARVEEALRDKQATALVNRLVQINRRRDNGVHSLGEIWRRHRISCPPREQWGNYLLGVLSKKEAEYLKFHVQDLGCRQCQANLEDLESQRQKGTDDSVDRRRHKYFQTSAGYLKND